MGKRGEPMAAPSVCLYKELCLRSSYLQFQDSFYEQTGGAAMKYDQVSDT